MTVTLLPANQFPASELTSIYNQSRTEYLVPMPMSVNDLEYYIHLYQIDLAQSLVAMKEGNPAGLAMLGIRGKHSWVTRLGVYPDQRGDRIGFKLMEGLVNNSVRLKIEKMVLEVISDNHPAHCLFQMFNFVETRTLLILDRVVTPVKTMKADEFQLMSRSEILARLVARTGYIAWTGQTESFQQMTELSGFRLAGSESGWLAFNLGGRGISHLTYGPGCPENILGRLLDHLHATYPQHSSRVENIPSDDPLLDIFAQKGYQICFKRIEMERKLGGR